MSFAAFSVQLIITFLAIIKPDQQTSSTVNVYIWQQIYEYLQKLSLRGRMSGISLSKEMLLCWFYSVAVHHTINGQ